MVEVLQQKQTTDCKQVGSIQCAFHLMEELQCQLPAAPERSGLQALRISAEHNKKTWCLDPCSEGPEVQILGPEAPEEFQAPLPLLASRPKTALRALLLRLGGSL